MNMIALVDVNNFYASVERMFNPALNGRPVVVLSNNDGCAIARSDEAKQIGIIMGTPVFMIKETLAKHNVAVFSSNYTLYGSMSERVMTILKSFAPKTEVYSIDEAFLDLTDLKHADLLSLSTTIRETVYQHTGLPISIGIAPTKALAKLANKYAKKKKKAIGIHIVNTQPAIDELLSYTQVGDIWGIGKQYQKVMLHHNIKTAFDLVHTPEEWIRKQMSVVGQRLLYELKGISCIRWEDMPPPKQNICMGRSFGTILTTLKEIKQAIASHTAACAKKLRQEKSNTSRLHVFIQTNPHRGDDPQYFGGITIQIPVATNNSHELVKMAMKALHTIYRPGFNYTKGGVEVLDLLPEHTLQLGLFDRRDRAKDRRLMKAMDGTNQLFGDNVVRYGSHGYGDHWKLKTEFISQCYTTRLDQIMTVKS